MRISGRLLASLLVSLLRIGATSLPSQASPCDGSGVVVVQDATGDINSPQHDITGITMAEGFGGTEAGRLRVVLQLAATTPPDSTVAGAWIVSWKEFGGDSSMTLTVSRCRGAFTGSWQWQSTDGQFSATGPLDDLILTPGRMDLFIARDKFGDPPPGSLLTDVGASTLVFQQLTPPLGCAPTLRTDVAGPGTYVMGDCIVGVRDRPAVAALLGPPVPNPARSGVRLRLELPGAIRSAVLEGEVLDGSGRIVRRLSQSAESSLAWLFWDLREDSGCRALPGTYWVRVRAGGFTASRSVVVLR